MHAIDNRVVGAQQVAVELQIVGRIGKNEINAVIRQFLQFRNAVADEYLAGRHVDAAAGRTFRTGGGCPQGH